MQIVDINGIAREVNSVFPDPKYPGYVRLEFARHHEWLTLSEFLTKNPKLKELVKGTSAPPPDDLGVVLKSGKNSLKDTTKNWKQNVFQGMWCWISRGKGEGQKRHVTSNTKNTLILDKDWEIKPNKTSQYVISYNVQNSIRDMGNTLPQENLKDLERRSIQMDKDHGRLSSESLKKNIKYLKPEEI